MSSLGPNVENKLNLRAGERVIWTSIDPYSRDNQGMPDSARIGLKKAVASFASALLLLIFALWPAVHPNLTLIVTAGSVGFFALGVVQLQDSRFFRRVNHFTFILHAPSFVSCVITDARVFLFNRPNDPITILQRDDLASPVPELDRGTSALLLTQKSTGKRFLFVTDNFVPPMRALAPATASQGVFQ